MSGRPRDRAAPARPGVGASWKPPEPEMPMRTRSLAFTLLAGALWAAGGSPSPVLAQVEAEARPPVDWSPFRIANVLPTGQPVIPVFEGWYRNPDGSTTYSFGYFNMNSEETLDIPLGPDNVVEPRQFDGMQPTRLLPAPQQNGRRNRHESVFSVTVPEGFDQPIVWTLRQRGQTISAPASTARAYIMDDVASATRAPVAPTFRFGPAGAEGKGRAGPVGGPLAARVGEPLPVSVSVDLAGRPRSTVTWYPHQGPGEVSFSAPESTIDKSGEVSTTVTFGEPGEYMLRVTALESPAALVQHCCWTNGYVRVTVTR